MQRIALFILIGSLSVLVWSCTSFSIYDTNILKKGMKPDAVLDMVSKGPIEEFDLSIASDPSTKYHVMVFDLKHGGVNAEYYVVFKDDQLMYWGYPYEWNRYPDTVYNEIGAAAVKKMDSL